MLCFSPVLLFLPSPTASSSGVMARQSDAGQDSYLTQQLWTELADQCWVTLGEGRSAVPRASGPRAQPMPAWFCSPFKYAMLEPLLSTHEGTTEAASSQAQYKACAQIFLFNSQREPQSYPGLPLGRLNCPQDETAAWRWLAGCKQRECVQLTQMPCSDPHGIYLP